MKLRWAIRHPSAAPWSLEQIVPSQSKNNTFPKKEINLKNVLEGCVQIEMREELVDIRTKIHMQIRIL